MNAERCVICKDIYEYLHQWVWGEITDEEPYYSTVHVCRSCMEILERETHRLVMGADPTQPVVVGQLACDDCGEVSALTDVDWGDLALCAECRDGRAGQCDVCGCWVSADQLEPGWSDGNACPHCWAERRAMDGEDD